MAEYRLQIPPPIREAYNRKKTAICAVGLAFLGFFSTPVAVAEQTPIPPLQEEGIQITI